MNKLDTSINGHQFEMSLENNETARAFDGLLPLDLEMQELNGNEKYYFLADPLPSDPKSIGTIEAGDVMLYQDNCIVVFYESHLTSYKYTPIGKIDDTEGLIEALGEGSAQVEFRAI